jgi:hypothetical protein
MKEEKNKQKSHSIYIQAVIAVLFINLIHKFVREIPGSFMANILPGIIITITMAVILATSIALLFLKNKIGLYLGIIPGIWATFQWVIYHVILANPDINGIWWYPIFPITQGLLIIYFSLLALKQENIFKQN